MDAAVQPAKEAQAEPVAVAPGAPSDLAEKFGWLPCQLSLEIPIVNFSVGDLLRLQKDSIVETACLSPATFRCEPMGSSLRGQNLK